jgi:hypothetical protein
MSHFLEKIHVEYNDEAVPPYKARRSQIESRIHPTRSSITRTNPHTYTYTHQRKKEKKKKVYQNDYKQKKKRERTRPCCPRNSTKGFDQILTKERTSQAKQAIKISEQNVRESEALSFGRENLREVYFGGS